MKRYISASDSYRDDEKAIQVLLEGSDLDLDAAKFLVEWEFSGDKVEVAQNIAYLLHQVSYEDWAEIYEDYKEDGLDPSYWEDEAFEGVIYLEP